MEFEKLWKMEKSFWLDGAPFFKKSMASNACMVFPAPAGMLTGQEIIESLRNAPRWDFVDFESKTETNIGETAVIAYKATGQRDSEAPYVALCASTYVRENGNWLLLSHQQTPEKPPRIGRRNSII